MDMRLDSASFFPARGERALKCVTEPSSSEPTRNIMYCVIVYKKRPQYLTAMRFCEFIQISSVERQRDER